MLLRGTIYIAMLGKRYTKHVASFLRIKNTDGANQAYRANCIADLKPLNYFVNRIIAKTAQTGAGYCISVLVNVIITILYCVDGWFCLLGLFLPRAHVCPLYKLIRSEEKTVQMRYFPSV